MADKKVEYRRCRQCTEPISPKSTALCDAHLLANRERGRMDRERRKLLGICRSCNEPLSPSSKTWCEKHHQSQNKASREWAQKMRSFEMCVDCRRKPRMLRKQRCENCQPLFDEKKKTLCRRVGCGEAVDPTLKYFCRVHADEENEKLKARREKMKQQRVCIFCFEQIEESESTTHVLCEQCRNKQKEQRRAVGTV